MFNLFNFCITNLKQNLKRAGNPASDNGCNTDDPAIPTFVRHFSCITFLPNKNTGRTQVIIFFKKKIINFWCSHTNTVNLYTQKKIIP